MFTKEIHYCNTLTQPASVAIVDLFEILHQVTIHNYHGLRLQSLVQMDCHLKNWNVIAYDIIGS